MSPNIKMKSTLRPLTAEEVLAVSGGIALGHIIFEVAKVIIIIVLDSISNNNEKKDEDPNK